MVLVCSLINAVFYFLKPVQISDVLTIKEMFKQLSPKSLTLYMRVPLYPFSSQAPVPSSHLG